MDQFSADLHIHGPSSRISSQQNSIPDLVLWARRKGIQLLGTGDFIFPDWLTEVEGCLEQQENGLLQFQGGPDVSFLLTAEIECMFQQGGQTYQVHMLVTAPDLGSAKVLSRQLGGKTNLKRGSLPRFNLSPPHLVECILEICPDSLVIPVHIWSPWGSLYGSKRGFSSFCDCFGSLSSEVHAVETGLSSDPGACWRVSELDGKQIVSFSNAHNPQQIGREFTLFSGELSYQGVYQAIKSPDGTRIIGTVEFCSEMGQHYFNGHRDCRVVKSPVETQLEGKNCPACRREITVGTLQRGLEIADRDVKDLEVTQDRGWIHTRALPRPPYRKTIPLRDIIASTYGIRGKESITVDRIYETALGCGATEYEILLEMSEPDLRSFVDPQVSEGILRVREHRFRIQPGYDGVLGQAELFEEKEIAEMTQMRLF